MALSQLFWDVLMPWNLKSTFWFYFSLKMIHFLSLNIWYVIYVVFWIKYWHLKLPHHCILFYSQFEQCPNIFGIGFVNKESVIAVFLDVEKAYDMMWRETIDKIKWLIMNIGGEIYTWIKVSRSIQVRIGNEMSNAFQIENGSPQGRVLSPLLVSIMINYVFNQVEPESLFADEGVIWKRGRDIWYIYRKIQ